MSSRFLRLFILLYFGFLAFSANSQSNNLKLISYRERGRILLRWAPVNASEWLEWNKRGYTLFRYTVIRDSARVYPPEKLELVKHLNPASVIEWERASMDNKYASIAAQAIYGDSFRVEVEKDEASILEMIQLAKEQDMRFSFALLSADQSFEVAQLAGLGYEDSNIRENEVYLYKLYGNSGVVVSDTVYSYVDIFNAAPLPTILNLNAEFRNRSVSLIWRKDYYDDTYSSYLIEKSTDGKNFRVLENLPSITTAPQKELSGKWMLKMDSLESNKITYYYRVRGKTPFGIIGPPSEVISGYGREDFDLTIAITKTFETNKGVTIEWTIRGPGIKQISQILIERSGNSSDYVSLDTVSSSLRRYQDKQPIASNYYRIVAMNELGMKNSSLPYLVQREDSIPPISPKGLIGIADTSGIVELRWQRNLEQDILGYRIFRSRVRSAEYRQVTIKAIPDTMYRDRVDLSTLSRFIYYKVLAVDNRGNNSELSKEVLVELPDTISPVSPRITGYKLVGSDIKISWINSSSSDVVLTKLIKVKKDSIIDLKSIPISENLSGFTDTTFVEGVVSYFLLAVDKSGNISKRSNVIQVEASPPNSTAEMELSAKVDRKGKVINLSWSYLAGEKEFRIYRALGDTSISLYKVFFGQVHEFEDKSLVMNSIYHYRVQAIDIKSGQAIFSNQVKVIY